MAGPAAFYDDPGVECEHPARRAQGIPEMSHPLGLLHALVGAAALLVSPHVLAQALPQADQREVRAYAFTEAALAQYVDATRRLSAIPLDCDAEEPAVRSLTEAAEKIDSVPGARAAVKAAGLTSRQYVVFAFALIENAFAAYELEQPGGRLPAGISMSNIEFLREHSAVIERLANDTDVAACKDDDGGSG
jgi:hypothetical protein